MKVNYYSLLFLIAWCLGCTNIIRADERDSLVTALRQAKPDTNLVLKYYETGWQFEGDLPDSALAFYNKGLALSRQLNFKKGEIKYYFNATAVYNIKGDFNTSLKLNKQSVAMAQAYGNPQLLANALGNVGSSYDLLTKYDSAVYYYLAASQWMERTKDSSHLAIAYCNLCATYTALRQYNLSLLYGQKAIAFYNNGIRSFDYVAALNNIGESYSCLKNTAKAIDYFKLAYAQAKQTGNTSNIVSCLSNLAHEYMYAKDYPRLKTTCNEQLTLAKQLNSPYQLSGAYHVSALYQFYTKNYQAALTLEQAALAIANTNKIDEQLHKSYTTLSNIYMAMGDIQTGDSLAELSAVYADKMVNEKIIANAAVYEANYATQLQRNKNVQQQQELQQKKAWLMVLVVLIVFVVLLSALVYYAQRQRQKTIQAENILKEEKIQALQREKQLEATQALLQGEEKERSRLARDLHDGLGGILSSVKYSFNQMRETIILNPQQAESFTKSVNKLDDSMTELRRIAQNMMPENLHRFGLDASLRDLCTGVSADGKIKVIYQSFGMEAYKSNATVDLALYRIAQEILHNTVKHAQAQQLILQLSFSKAKLLLNAEDDGKGFDTAILKTDKGSGFKSMQNRVAFLNGQLQIDSSAQGTNLTIEIPV